MTLTAVLVGMRERLREPLARALESDGWTLRSLPRWRAGDEADLVVLQTDDPASAVASVRVDVTAPLLIVTAADDSARSAALVAGADLCMGADVSSDLLVVQVRALVRRILPRRQASDAPVTGAGGLRLDPVARRAYAGEEEIALSAREFDLLRRLVEQQGRVQRRGDLIAAVWGPRYSGDSNTVDVHVSWLRRKLPRGCGVRITTLRGVGYRLDVL